MRGILINNSVHTGNKLGLVMTAKSLPAPTVKKDMVEIPGRNGALDMTEALTGVPTYNNRSLSFSFVGDGSRAKVLELIDTLLLYHGQHITIVVDDLEGWTYEGRAEVSYVDHYHYVEFELVVDAQPFRYSAEQKQYSVSGVTSRSLVMENTGFAVVPTVKVTASTTIKIGTDTYTISSGTYEDERLVLSNGNNTWVITSTGTVTITFREAKI